MVHYHENSIGLFINPILAQLSWYTRYVMKQPIPPMDGLVLLSRLKETNRRSKAANNYRAAKLTMPNRCAFGCNTGWDREKPDPLPTSGDAKIATFHFPMKKPELLAKWKKFVNLQDWIPTESSVLCEKHFEPQYIKQGSRTTLKWEQYPIPTIQSNTAQKRPATTSTIPILWELQLHLMMTS